MKSKIEIGTLILFYITLNFGSIFGGKCPAPQIIEPCVCVNDNITCGGHERYNLQSIFSKMSNILAEEDKGFYQFTLSNTNISQMVENTFQEITFKYILLQNTTNLKDIQSHTFSTTASTILEFEQLGESLIGKDNDNGLSEAMSSLVNVEKIVFDSNHLRQIRNRFFRNLFGEQKNLKVIDFNPNFQMTKTIKSIGNYAFYYLINLRFINFFGHQINKIEPNSFDFFKPSNNTLEINFSNNDINEFSFKRRSFLRAKRPIILNLWNNPIKYLDEKTFGPFFKIDERNKIIIGSDNQTEIKFECDCRSFWIIKIKDRIKRQMNDNVVCKSGKSLWNLTAQDFLECKAKNKH